MRSFVGHFGRVFTEERKGNESIESGEQSDEAFHKFLFCFCVISRFVSDFFRRQNYRRPSQRKDGRRSTLIMIIVNSRGAVSRRPSIFFSSHFAFQENPSSFKGPLRTNASRCHFTTNACHPRGAIRCRFLYSRAPSCGL